MNPMQTNIFDSQLYYADYFHCTYRFGYMYIEPYDTDTDIYIRVAAKDFLKLVVLAWLKYSSDG